MPGKRENMQIKINKEFKRFTLVSSVKTEDIKLLKKYKPGALELKDDKDNTKFGISYVEDHPSVSACGVTFAATTADGYAKAVFALPDVEDGKLKDAVADYVGAAIENLGIIEAQVAAEANTVRSARQNLMATMVVVEE